MPESFQPQIAKSQKGTLIRGNIKATAPGVNFLP